jgi:predicted Zn-dependent protease
MLLMAASAHLAGCSRNPATGERELRWLSDEQEIAMGDEAAPQFEQEFKGAVPDPQVQAYVERVGKQLAAQSERPMPYKFSLLRSDIPNAFALPGGRIYVTNGLLQVMGSQRELGAVLGHEVGHVAARHNVRALERQMGAELLAAVAGAAVGGRGGQAAEVAAKVTAGMLNLRYSRQDEYQADQLGIRYLAKANDNPWGMVEMLNELAEAAGSEGSRLGEMFSTHPLTNKRIEEAADIVRRQYPQARQGDAAPNQGEFLRIRQQARQHLVPQQQSTKSTAAGPQQAAQAAGAKPGLRIVNASPPRNRPVSPPRDAAHPRRFPDGRQDERQQRHHPGREHNGGHDD